MYKTDKNLQVADVLSILHAELMLAIIYRFNPIEISINLWKP